MENLKEKQERLEKLKEERLEKIFDQYYSAGMRRDDVEHQNGQHGSHTSDLQEACKWLHQQLKEARTQANVQARELEDIKNYVEYKEGGSRFPSPVVRVGSLLDRIINCFSDEHVDCGGSIQNMTPDAPVTDAELSHWDKMYTIELKARLELETMKQRVFKVLTDRMEKSIDCKDHKTFIQLAEILTNAWK